MINAAQIRAARALLNWSQEVLAEKSGIARATIKNIENELTVPRTETMAQIEKAFDDHRVEFTDRSGLRLRSDVLRMLEGESAIRLLFDEIYLHLSQNNGATVRVSGLNEGDYGAVSRQTIDLHYRRMMDLKNINYFILCRQGDENFDTPYAEYRWVDKGYFENTPFYVFGDTLAIVLWGSPLQLLLLRQPRLADSYSRQFDYVWDRSEKPSRGLPNNRKQG